MNAVVGILFAAGMIVLAFYHRDRLLGGEIEYDKRWLTKWLAKGLVLPVLVWVMLNAGRRPIVPAIIPMLPPASASWFGHLIFGISYVGAQTGPALNVIASFWAALTLAWMTLVALRKTKEQAEFRRASLAWSCLCLPMGVLLYHSYGLGALSLATLAWAWPLAHMVLSLKPVAAVPVYGGAIAKMKFGKYREAEQAIISQLEKCETDFDGWIMLANLYAGQFHDVAEAERTIHDLCNEPKTTPSQVAVALNLLADWQLQHRSDPAAAGRALDEIISRLPGSHMARMAALRKGQLPTTSEAWKEQQHPKIIHLPPLSEHLDESKRRGVPTLNRIEAMARINQCTEKLKRDPNDVETREQLALTLADQMEEPDLAIEQLDLLIEMPEQSRTKIAEWLALMAAWEIRRGTNPDSARHYLRRLIREHPDSVQAFAAQRRLSLLDAELRMAKAGAEGGTRHTAGPPG